MVKEALYKRLYMLSGSVYTNDRIGKTNLVRNIGTEQCF